MAPVSASAERAIEAFRAAGGELDPDVAPLLATIGDAAPALLPSVLGDPSIPRRVLELGLDGPLDAAAIEAHLSSLQIGDDEASLRHALRRGRHVHLVRLALREAMGRADVDRTAREMSELAVAATELALRGATRAVTAQHGVPQVEIDGRERPTKRVCLGMGKLGGGELNLGSDVDLCFYYETDETLDPPGQKLTTHEIESRIATRASKILADVEADGFVFRVDLRLRPEGARGPIASSLASCERYYESFGRAWERAVLLRARPIAGDLDLGAQLLDAVRPFVFRRTVDPRIARDMGQMLERTRLELSVDDVHDVKLGRGGIREAEFFVQTLQLVWGGRHPELQVPGTLSALSRLLRLGLVSDREARELERSWALLRRIEHRIHVWTGYQTHRLPGGEELAPFARSLGFASSDALLSSLGEARDVVARLFRSLTDETSRATSTATVLAEQVTLGQSAERLASLATEVLGVHDGDEAAVHLARLAKHADDPLGPRARERHPELGPRLLEAIAESAEPAWALRYTAEFFARLRGWDYLRLLEERGALRRFVGLFGASDALAAAIVGHPEDLDVLLEIAVPTLSDVREAHETLAVDPSDPEAFVGRLRAHKRRLTLRIGLTYASGELDLNGALALLSELAIHQVQLAVRQASAETFARFGEPGPGPSGRPATLVVVALGKLGARELGWGSDLDLVFLFDGDGTSTGAKALEHVELFTRIAQRTLRVLSQADREGPGYATDTRLRPSGSQGTLVASLETFERYRTSAAGWERQAWVRAVPIAGEPATLERARTLLRRAAYEGPAPSAADVIAMRARIEGELALETALAVHPKLGRGALLDIEFAVQFLQLVHARGDHDAGTLEKLRSPATLEALAALASISAISTADAAELEAAWRFFRSVEQSLRLVDESGDGRLHLRSRVADRVARRMGLRDREGVSAAQALEKEHRRHAERTREMFERVVS